MIQGDLFSMREEKNFRVVEKIYHGPMLKYAMTLGRRYYEPRCCFKRPPWESCDNCPDMLKL